MSTLLAPTLAHQRQPGEIDYVEKITEIFRELGHPNPENWTQCDLIQQAAGQNSLMQRFLINRHWRIELIRRPEDTQYVRYMLMDVCDDEAYFDVFKKSIAPFLLSHGMV